jgi:hypothetical protein
MRKKPKGVPAEATFHEQWGEWILGSKVKGKKVGEWRQWHATRGHLTCIETFDDRGVLQLVRRFHPDGTMSQRIPHQKGKGNGVAMYWRCATETTEQDFRDTAHPDIVRMQVAWKDGIWVGSWRFFNRDDVEVSSLGVPRPAGVPKEASSTNTGDWCVEEGGRKDFCWRADGTLKADAKRRGSTLERRRSYHPDGSVAIELDYKAKRGTYRKAKSPGSDIVLAKMRGDVEVIRFDMVKITTWGSFQLANEQYFDRAGKQVPSTGSVNKPHDAVVKVTDGQSDPEHFWLDEASRTSGKKHGVDRYWRLCGTKLMDVSFDEGRISSLQSFDEDGELRFEETYRLKAPASGTRARRERPVITRFRVHTADALLEVVFDDKGNAQRFQKRNRAGKVVHTHDNGGLGALTVASFTKLAKQRFEELLALPEVVVFLESFEISSFATETFDEYFKATAVARDGGGNVLVAIGEGKHEGAVFFNDHEEDLRSLDAVGEFLNEASITPEKTSKDKLVQAMPFFKWKVAGSLGELLGEIKAASSFTYRGHLDGFARVRDSADPKRPARRATARARSR